MEKISESALRVLIGVYNEKDKKKLTAPFFGMGGKEFANAVNELEQNEYIEGADITTGGRGAVPQIAWLDNVKITLSGVQYLAEFTNGNVN
ncbi:MULTISPECIES: YjcQ family protein [Bacillus cereus group]|uniref:YjcQ family protein n=1 Tax=Bacillus cereus group TaxID=86661 RepID=UPI000BEC4D5F|nr:MULTISPECIES: YjcQ family protein [Bacillus cereus group]PEA63383.1 hypothetical protein COO18_28865 [Bacillus toyonensis]HDR7378163.1 hypothetical protein [Bacillus toyonensis]